MRVTEQGNKQDVRVTYRQPTLVRYGAVRDNTASGSGPKLEAKVQGSCEPGQSRTIRC